MDLPTAFFRVGWALWVLAFVVLETLALVDKDRGDTLSEQVWYLSRTSVVKFLLAAFVLWLGYHFIWERPG